MGKRKVRFSELKKIDGLAPSLALILEERKYIELYQYHIKYSSDKDAKER